MKRRLFVRKILTAAIVSGAWAFTGDRVGAEELPFLSRSRVKPGQKGWPSDSEWAALNEETHGCLIKVEPILNACVNAPDGLRCERIFEELKNPYFIADEVSLTQTTGWVDAWTSRPSVYAVGAQKTSHVVAAVNFAREKNLRLVIKGGGHSYLGTSNSPDSLLIWTRAMNEIELHDAFVPRGCIAQIPPQPAVSVGAGAIWMHTYNKVTTEGGRYVQGGGCGTVGVAGLVQGGAFGSYSKEYGLAAASLLEAEIVTADGMVRTVNECIDPDLFWALKGGGGGTFGVVTRVTLKTHALPRSFGFATATIKATSSDAFRDLVEKFIQFYATRLHTRHWGEIANFKPDHTLEIQLSFQGLEKQEADELWAPFWAWIVERSADLRFTVEPAIRTMPAARRWDAAFFHEHASRAMLPDDRPDAPPENVFWSANLSEAGHFIHRFESVWLPVSMLDADAGQRNKLVDALVKASRHSKVEIHFQKGLAGGSPQAIAGAKSCSMNPVVTDAFALAIIASEGPPAFPGLRGHEPNVTEARENAAEVAQAMRILKEAVPAPGSYVAESSFFEEDWKRSYWGRNYESLLAVKRKYDPAGLFFVRHGVGSEIWSDDGFTPLGDPKA